MYHRYRFSIAVLLVAGMFLPAQAGGTKTVEASPGLVEIRVEGGAKTGAQFLATQPPTLPHRSYRLSNGDAVCVFNAVNNSQYVIACFEADYENKTTDLTTWVVTVGDNPTPTPPGPTPPTPNPRPEGLAGEVYDEAIKVGQPEEASKMATNFYTVASEIGAGKHTTLTSARARITELNALLRVGQEWKPFSTFISKALNERATRLDTARVMFEDIAVGLDAVE